MCCKDIWIRNSKFVVKSQHNCESLSNADPIFRERKKLLTQQPKFSLKSVGENALLSVEKERRIPLFMSDLQSLMLYCTVGGKTPYYPDRCVQECQLRTDDVRERTVCTDEAKCPGCNEFRIKYEVEWSTAKHS